MTSTSRAEGEAVVVGAVVGTETAATVEMTVGVEAILQIAMGDQVSTVVEGVVEEAQAPTLLTLTPIMMDNAVDLLDPDVMAVEQVILTAAGVETVNVDEMDRIETVATKREFQTLSSSTPTNIRDWTHLGSSTSFGRN